jgi:hypothetical protein
MEPSEFRARPRKKFIRAREQKRYAFLKKEFGNKKKLPRGYGLQALIALSYYPELKDVSIEFIFGVKINSLSTFPELSSLIFKQEDRTYQIIISRKIREAKEPVLLRHLTFNAQIGVLGHELGHVTDFIRKSSAALIEVGILYFYPDYQKKLERKTDLIAIKHGLGYQLREYNLLIDKLKIKYPEETYYSDYYPTYMCAEEIDAKIKTMEIYR